MREIDADRMLETPDLKIHEAADEDFPPSPHDVFPLIKTLSEMIAEDFPNQQCGAWVVIIGAVLANVSETAMHDINEVLRVVGRPHRIITQQ